MLGSLDDDNGYYRSETQTAPSFFAFRLRRPRKACNTTSRLPLNCTVNIRLHSFSASGLSLARAMNTSSLMSDASRRGSNAPAGGDVAVTSVAGHYHIGRVQANVDALMWIALADSRSDALELACRTAVGQSARVFVRQCQLARLYPD